MRVLLDECLPRKLKQDLLPHELKTVPECGWSGRKNGDLLRLAQDQFDIFLTVDRNLVFQQDVPKFEIGIIVLVARSNSMEALRPLIPEVLQSLLDVAPGKIIRLGG